MTIDIIKRRKMRHLSSKDKNSKVRERLKNASKNEDVKKVKKGTITLKDLFPPVEVKKEEVWKPHDIVKDENNPVGIDNAGPLKKAPDKKRRPGEQLFKKGSAPVNKGRPKGSRNKITVALEQMGDENAKAVYKKLIELALGGDINACRIILDRVYPVHKGRKISLEFDGPIDTIQDVNAVSKQVVKMAIDGEISCEEAEDYGRILEQRLKVITDAEVMNKIQQTYEKVDSIKNGG